MVRDEAKINEVRETHPKIRAYVNGSFPRDFRNPCGHGIQVEDLYNESIGHANTQL